MSGRTFSQLSVFDSVDSFPGESERVLIFRAALRVVFLGFALIFVWLFCLAFKVAAFAINACLPRPACFFRPRPSW
jgi:hypothetical protein